MGSSCNAGSRKWTRALAASCISVPPSSQVINRFGGMMVMYHAQEPIGGDGGILLTVAPSLVDVGSTPIMGSSFCWSCDFRFETTSCSGYSINTKLKYRFRYLRFQLLHKHPDRTSSDIHLMHRRPGYTS